MSSLAWTDMLRAVVPQDGELELEKKLVARAQAGDREATGELLHKYGPGLYRSVLLPRLGSEAAAKDALAETYAKVVERMDRFTWQNVGFYPWLRTVALRVALDHLRARKRMLLWDAEDVEREVDASATTTPVDQALSDRRDREAARTKVEDALGKIHPRYARVIRMRVLEERPREEVASELEVSPATFDVLLHRAVAALKKALGASAAEDGAGTAASDAKHDTKTDDRSPEGSRTKTRTGTPTKREKLDDA
jgi:RNA polymerase sigma-70 factor (ECF subfamily)